MRLILANCYSLSFFPLHKQYEWTTCTMYCTDRNFRTICGRQGGLHESCDVSMKSMLRETMPFPCSSSGSSGGSGGGSSGGGSSRSISSVVVQ